MTRDDIARMAREAGIEHHENVDEMRSPFCDGVWFEDLEDFAGLVAAAERDECAKVCEELLADTRYETIPQEARVSFLKARDAIRARGRQ